MMTNRSVLAAALATSMLWMASPEARTGGQSAPSVKPKVDVVQTIGCVERRGDTQPVWWLTRASAPAVSRVGVFNTLQVE